VSVVVVNWNTRDLLRDCLASLPHDAEAVQLEVIVVDNGSEDGSAEMVAEEFPSARLLRNEENLGFVRANNQGLRVSRGEYAWMLNSDTRALPGCVERLVEVAASDPKIGAVAPKLLNPDGSYQYSAGRFARVLLKMLPAGFEDRYNRAFDQEAMAATQPLRVDWLVGAALLCRREVLDQVGPLDERYLMWLDDMDWCRKLARVGLGRVFVPDAHVMHYGRQSAAKLQSEEFIGQLLDSEYLYLRLQHGLLATWLVFGARLAKECGHWCLARSGEARRSAAFRLAHHRRRLVRHCLSRLPRQSADQS